MKYPKNQIKIFHKTCLPSYEINLKFSSLHLFPNTIPIHLISLDFLTVHSIL